MNKHDLMREIAKAVSDSRARIIAVRKGEHSVMYKGSVRQGNIIADTKAPKLSPGASGIRFFTRKGLGNLPQLLGNQAKSLLQEQEVEHWEIPGLRHKTLFFGKKKVISGLRDRYVKK